MRTVATAVAAWLLSGCGAGGVCDDPANPPSYSTDIAPILASRCLSCHSVEVRGPNRQGAPRDSNYDTYEEVVAKAEGIVDRAVSDSQPMPPRTSGLPKLTSGERLLLKRWVNCGRGG